MSITRALVREVLSRYQPTVAPGDWRFERSELGRPSVARDMPESARAWHFNIAHTEGLVVMAVARVTAVGVDAERADSRPRLEIARQYFSPVEAAALEALPAADQPGRFQRLWTLKEAYLKATGEGIAGGLAGITFHLDQDAVRFECATDPEVALWQFREFTLPGGFRVALACRVPANAPLVVRLFDFPPQASPSGEEQRSEPEQRGKADAIREGGEDHAG